MSAIITMPSADVEIGMDPTKLGEADRQRLFAKEIDAGLWKTLPPFSKIHRAALFAVLHQNAELKGLGAVFEPNMKSDESRKREHVGVYAASFAGFRCTLNWTPKKQGSIPRRHILVECLDEAVGIVGPFATIRDCWTCDLRGYRDEQGTVPWVVPGQPCPRCAALDWWGRIVTPWHLVDRAGEVVARDVADDRAWSHMDGDRGQAELRKAQTT